jgi:hypothetical protein
VIAGARGRRSALRERRGEGAELRKRVERHRRSEDDVLDQAMERHLEDAEVARGRQCCERMVEALIEP